MPSPNRQLMPKGGGVIKNDEGGKVYEGAYGVIECVYACLDIKLLTFKFISVEIDRIFVLI